MHAKQLDHGTPSKRGVTMAEARRYLGVGHTTLYRLIANGDLRTFKIGRGRRTTIDWLDELIAKREAA